MLSPKVLMANETPTEAPFEPGLAINIIPYEYDWRFKRLMQRAPTATILKWKTGDKPRSRVVPGKTNAKAKRSKKMPERVSDKARAERVSGKTRAKKAKRVLQSGSESQKIWVPLAPPSSPPQSSEEPTGLGLNSSWDPSLTSSASEDHYYNEGLSDDDGFLFLSPMLKLGLSLG